MNEMVIVKDLANKPHLLTLDQIKAIISNDHILSSKLGVDTDIFIRFHSYKRDIVLFKPHFQIILRNPFGYRELFK